MVSKKIPIQTDTKSHKHPSSSYTLESLKKLYRKEGFKLSSTLIDKDNKKIRKYRKRANIIEDLAHFRNHSFPDLPSSFWPFLNAKLKKVKVADDEEYKKKINQFINEFKKQNPKMTFYDRNIF